MSATIAELDQRRRWRGEILFKERSGEFYKVPGKDAYLVPGSRGHYEVQLLPKETCTCEDADMLSCPWTCKHVWAMRFFLEAGRKPTEEEALSSVLDQIPGDLAP